MKSLIDDLVVVFVDIKNTVEDLNHITQETTSINFTDKINYWLIAVVLLVIACLLLLVVIVKYYTKYKVTISCLSILLLCEQLSY